MSCTRFAGPIAVLLATIPLPAAAHAQELLRSAKRMQCSFSTYASGDWVAGSPRAETKPSKLTLEFAAIDVEGGTADSISPAGPIHLTVRATESTAHFMQIATSGALYITTVFATVGGRDPLPGGRLRAVHTRHEYTVVSLPGFTSRPEQYYGDCAIGGS